MAAQPAPPSDASPTSSAAPAPMPYSGRKRHIPFVAHIGAEITRAEGNVAVVELDLQPQLLNNHGAGHGGIVMTLLDVAMANAALSKLDYTREIVTVDMHIAFMRPSKGRLVATGRAVGGGRSVAFCEAEIVDDSGEVIAKSMGTFRYRDPVKKVDGVGLPSPQASESPKSPA